jgi:membrane dipeptidase
VAANYLDVHRSATVIDTHSDTFSRVLDEGLNFFDGRSGLAVNLPQMVSGGLDVQMFALYIAPGMPPGCTVRRAMAMAGTMFDAIANSKGRLVLVQTAKQLKKAVAAGKQCALLSVEGGHIIEGDLNVLRSFRNLGVISMTLTHARNNEFADSSQDHRHWGGLNDLGRQIVEEMNRLRMIIDVSHTSDETVEDVLKITKFPVIASHSCCMALCKHPRNLPDHLIKKIAKTGGVFHLTYYPPFLDDRASQAFEENWKRLRGELDGISPLENPKLMWEFYGRCAEGVPEVPLETLCQHIDHAVSLVGTEHVGVGSDWDGATVTVKDLENCGRLPNLTKALMQRGYNAKEVKQILGGNFIRVLEKVAGE